MNKKKKNTYYGFTLIEIITVVALLGILGVAAITMNPSINKTRLNAAAEQVRTDIEMAKQNAQTTGIVSGAVFTNAGSYTVYQSTVATPIKSPLTLQNMVVTLSSKYPGISISGNYTVEFDLMGQPSTGGGGSINLTDGTNTKTISVTANTGMVVDL